MGEGLVPLSKHLLYFLPNGIARACARVCVYVCACVRACVQCVCVCVCVMRVRVHARVKMSKIHRKTQKNIPPHAKKKSFSVCDVMRNMYI